MKTLVLAFYREGTSDERFLPIIIERTTTHILLQQAKQERY